MWDFYVYWKRVYMSSSDMIKNGQNLKVKHLFCSLVHKRNICWSNKEFLHIENWFKTYVRIWTRIETRIGLRSDNFESGPNSYAISCNLFSRHCVWKSTYYLVLRTVPKKQFHFLTKHTHRESCIIKLRLWCGIEAIFYIHTQLNCLLNKW